MYRNQMDALSWFFVLVFALINLVECQRQSSNQTHSNKTAQNQHIYQDGKSHKANIPSILHDIQSQDWTRSIARMIGSLVDEYANFVHENLARTRSYRRSPYTSGSRRSSPASYWSSGVRRIVHDGVGDDDGDDDGAAHEDPHEAVYEVASARKTRRRTPPPPSYHSFRSYPAHSYPRRPPPPPMYDYYEPESSSASDQLVEAFYGQTGSEPAASESYEPSAGSNYEAALGWPLESREMHHKHHEHHEVKEISYVYPILLALLILGALFVPFISLFLFLAVSAFNCHQLGSSGFANVTPIFGKKRRRRRRKRSLDYSEADGDDSLGLLLDAALPAQRNKTQVEEADDLKFVFGQQQKQLKVSKQSQTNLTSDLITTTQLPYAFGSLLHDSVGFDSDPNYKYDFGFRSAADLNAVDFLPLDALVDGLDRLSFVASSTDKGIFEPSLSELIYWRNKLTQTTESLRNALLEFGDEHF